MVWWHPRRDDGGSPGDQPEKPGSEQEETAQTPGGQGPPDQEAHGAWLAPTTTTPVDHVPLAEIHETWTPERTGQVSVMVTLAVLRTVGVVDPVLLRPRPDGPGFEIVTGHRIVAAARLAGLEAIPAVVRQMDDAQALTAMALDGSATGMLTPTGAAELRRRLLAAGLSEAAVEELLTTVPVAEERPAPETIPAIAAATEPEPETGPPPEILPTAAATEAEPETGPPPETLPIAAATEPEPETGPPPEPLPIAAATEPEPETGPPPEILPTAAVTEPEPQAARPPEPLPVTAAPAEAPATPPRWVPLPAGRPRLGRLSSAFVDSPRLLRHLTAERFSGTVEMVGADRRTDTLVFLDGACVAAAVDVEGRRLDLPIRLPAPDLEPLVEITVRPHPQPVAAALALGMRAPAELVGLHASFLHLPGLLEHLRRRRVQAAIVVTAAQGNGVILLDAGRPIAAYARRRGEAPGEEAEATDVEAVAELIASGDAEVDVHTGTVLPALDIEDLIAASGLEPRRG